MGIVIIGGLMFALILTLYVIPALYTFFSALGKEHPHAIEKVESPEKNNQ